MTTFHCRLLKGKNCQKVYLLTVNVHEIHQYNTIFNERRDVMEKVVCESCGREIPEKAKICPYCHQKNVARTGGAKPVLKKIWDAVVMLVGLVIILGGGVGKAFIMQALKNDIKKNIESTAETTSTEAEAVANIDNGADSEEELARMFMKALQERDISYLDKYLDKNVNNEKFLDWFNELLSDNDQFNVDDVTYEYGEAYESNGYVNKNVKATYVELKTNQAYAIDIYMHKAETSNGYKWFLGGI